MTRTRIGQRRPREALDTSGAGIHGRDWCLNKYDDTNTCDGRGKSSLPRTQHHGNGDGTR